MSNRLSKTFQILKQRQEKALVSFVTAGDPTIPKSFEIIDALCRSGTDILELGVPFSDPTADGPVIQRSSARALSNGVSLKTVLEMIRTIRKTIDTPIIIFSYYNPILAYGNEAFYRDAISSGADGVLVVDLPPEESDEMTSCWTTNALSLIRLIAPTTPPDRMQRIAKSASGFLYMVSKTGVTGSDGLNAGDFSHHVALLRTMTDLPVCVGFGISTPQDVKTVAAAADGVVIGSAFERLIEENINNPNLVSLIKEKTKTYKDAAKSYVSPSNQMT